jgi:hypothetical protein
VSGRVLLAALGVLAAGYGALLLADDGLGDLLATALWLAGGVLLHDLVLAPLTLLLGALAVRVLPPAARAPVAVGAVVLGSVTLLAIPVLGRFGARGDNPTLLDRPYGTGWLLLAGLVLLGVGLATARRARAGSGAGHEVGHGRL